ncbi:MAG: hypothetical protein KDA79_08805 [Planctomycetaceae bacterium]|nr:hypothetical protein [Planctomycetaceae bacterium]
MRVRDLFFSGPGLAAAGLLLILTAGPTEARADVPAGNSPDDAGAVLSHPPLRQNPPVSHRAAAAGPGKYVSPAGSDEADGTQQHPWRTVQHAVGQLVAGETLYLRGGTYFENVRCSCRGTQQQPITIRSFPGEQAVLDGSLRVFQENAAEAWEPIPGSQHGEYRSTQVLRNLRNVIGTFRDSMIGLSTYYFRTDLNATGELFVQSGGKEADVDPIYCGPGLWYDDQTGRVHVRLAPTHVSGAVNYQGETDPRKLPLIVAPFRSVPLLLDGARHVQVQDLIVRGGGYDTVITDYAVDVTFDNVTIWCGTYGMRSTRTGPLKFVNSALYGNCPPWLARGDTSKRAYPGRPFRDITRLNTHSCWVTEAGREFSVYAHPANDDWEISHSEFTDCHDGPYFGGVNLKFHHNLVENMQDDGIYLSQMYPRHLYQRGGARIEISQNVFRQCLTALAFGGPEDTGDEIFIYRNLFDLRQPVYTGRPRSAEQPEPSRSYGKLMGDHGSPPWPAMNIYHNTVVALQPARFAGMGALSGVRAGHPRRVFNNIFLHLARLPGYTPIATEAELVADGNLYWAPETTPEAAARLFTRFRGSEAFRNSQKTWPPGTSASSQVADPQFVRAEAEGANNDYSLKQGSPALNSGVTVPEDWPDPLRGEDAGQPDVGAVPGGGAFPSVGRQLPAEN